MEKTSIENIYTLDGKVPVSKAIPFGLQHILAMFVANLTPVTLIAMASGLDGAAIAVLLQNAMFVAGIATLIQLFAVWKIGARLPIVMGVSFTFVSILSFIGGSHGYGAVIGAVLIGGIFEGILGLLARHWIKIITPVVAACVVISIGISLLATGARSFGGGYNDDFGSWPNLILGFTTLASCLIFYVKAKGVWKQLSVLFGLFIGYILAIFMGKVDLSAIFSGGLISLPQLLPYKPVFDLSLIISVCIIFLVSSAETIGDTTAVVSGGLNRDVTDREMSGALACDGFSSTLSGLFGCPPLTSFSQNVGLVNMTGVVNRYTLAAGAVIMLLAGLIPPIGNFFASLPDAILGGCTIMMFGTIVISGIQMLSKAGFSQRNITIAALSISIGVGFTTTTESGLWAVFPQVIQDIFASNCVTLVFVTALILSFVLPADMEAEKPVQQEHPSTANAPEAAQKPAIVIDTE